MPVCSQAANPHAGDAGIPQDGQHHHHPGYECKWATNTVVHIMKTRNTGCLVNFKTEKLSYYKVKHSVENPLEKQVIFENHHKPIIDTQTWEQVQELQAA